MFSNNIDLRTTKYVGYTLPPQAINTSDKNEAWKKACMDALENIAIRQVAHNRRKFSTAYKVVQGDFQYQDITNSSVFLSEVDNLRSQTQIGKNLENYGFIEPIVHHLIGEFIKSPNPITIQATDALSTNDYIDLKTEKLWESVTKNLENTLNAKLIKRGMNPLKEDFQSEEEQQQYLQQIEQFKKENTPAEIEKYMNQSWRPIYIEWAEATLKEDYSRFDLDELDWKNMYDYLITGKCFRHIRVGYDYYRPEHWDVRDTFYDDSVERVEEGDYAGRLKYLTGNEVVAMFGHKLTESQIKDVLRSSYYNRTELNYTSGQNINNMRDWVQQGGGTLEMVPHQNYYPYQNARYIQEETGVDLGMEDMFPNGNQYESDPHYNLTDRSDLVRVIEGYWVSQQKIGYITLADPETGDLYTEIVTDEILKKNIAKAGIKQLKTVTIEQHEAKPEVNSIVWSYNPIVHYGAKICKNNTDLKEDLYLGGEPVDYQLRGESEAYHTRIPVIGINERTSFVSRMEQEQIDYNICLNMARDYMTKEVGLFFLMDLASLPHWIKDSGGEEQITKLLDLARESGIMPIDSDPGNTRGSFNQFQMVNMDLTQAMLGKLEYAQRLKRLAYEKIGFTPERLGTPTHETATGLQQAQQASFNQTEIWFDKFSRFQKRYGEVHINIAQYAKQDGTDLTVMYTDQDKVKTFIRMNDPYLPMRRLRITLDNNAKRRNELEIIKQIYMNDNTIEKDLESLSEVLASDSVSKILQLGRIQRNMMMAREQQAQMQRQKELEMQLMAEEEKDLRDKEWESKENALDRQMQIYKQQILALGFEKDKDFNKDGLSDVIQTGEMALKQMQYTSAEQQRQIENDMKRVESESNKRLQERKLFNEEKKIEVEKYKADKAFEIARENQTAAELRAKNKLPKK